MNRNIVLTALASVVLYMAVLNQWFQVNGFPFDIRTATGKKHELTQNLRVAIPNGPSPYNSVVDKEHAQIRIDFFEVENVYSLFQELSHVRFFARKIDSSISSAREEELQVFPDYARYMCDCEVLCFAAAQITVPLQAGNYEIFARVDGREVPIDIVTLSKNAFGRTLRHLPKDLWILTNSFSQLLIAAFLFTLLLTFYIDRKRYSANHSLLFSDLAIRAAVVALVSFSALTWPSLNRSVLLFFLYLSVLPAVVLANPIQALVKRAAGSAKAIAYPGQEISSTSVSGWLSISLSALTLVSIGLFAYVLCHHNTFNWAIYEERDFVRAADIFSSWNFPVVGPELLQGGQTPGGLLYVFLAPFTAIRNYPDVFSMLNKALFIGSAGVLYLLLSRYLSKPAASLATIIFCSSQVIYGLAFWPIHPSMSVFFFLCFLYSMVRGFVENNSRWILLSSAALALLMQFHFSYYLTLVPFCILIWQFDVIRKNTLPNSSRSFRAPIIWASVAVILIIFAPYFISEVTGDFANTRAIVSRDRATPAIATFALLGGQITPATSTWLWGAWGAGKEVISFLVSLALLVGLCGLVRSVVKEKDSSAARFALVILLLSAIPFTMLAISGSGYHCRHTLPFGILLFVITAYGFHTVLQWKPKFMATALSVFAVCIVLSWTNALAQEPTLRASWLLRGSEWAGEFKDRMKVAEYLIRDLKLSPEAYEKNTFWWNYAYSMDPTVYRRDFQRLNGGQNLKYPAWLGKDDLVVINSTGADLPFLERRYDLKKLERDISNRVIYVAHPRRNFGMVSPSGNSRNAIELSTVEREINDARIEEGFQKTEGRQIPSASASCQHYLLGLGKRARVRLLLSIKAERDHGKLRYDWKIDSSSLGNYFQEAKTIWKPRFIAEWKDNRGEVHGKQDFVVVDDVVGNILFKTPLTGSFYLEADKPWTISFGIDGYFDQSSMKMPSVEKRSWPLQDLYVSRLATTKKRLAASQQRPFAVE